MKRPLIVIIIVLTSLIAALQAWAAPLAQEPRPVIAQPEENAVVRGVVQIVGSAVHPQFQRYELYYAPSPVPSDQAWIFIGDAHFQQQPLGLLGTWDSRSVPDGTYALRVRVVKQDGNYNDGDPRRVLVANTRPVATATPEVTEAPAPTEEPTALPTELPATATIVVEIPAIETPTPIASTAQEPSPTPILTSGEADSTSLAEVEQILSPARLRDVAKKAAIYTVGLFLILGIFFALKALLVWLIRLIRP
jgi:hypothetical protein